MPRVPYKALGSIWDSTPWTTPWGLHLVLTPRLGARLPETRFNLSEHLPPLTMLLAGLMAPVQLKARDVGATHMSGSGVLLGRLRAPSLNGVV